MNRPPGDGGRDPEVALEQALRAMAGGGRRERPDPAAELSTGSRADGRSAARSRFTVAQILLMAAIIGVVLGMAGGLIDLVVR